MKIYTKTGDQGMTSLYGGERVSKSHLRIETYGTVDELNAWIGMIASNSENEYYYADLVSIQNHLFVLGAMLAVDGEHSELPLKKIDADDVEWIERCIDKIVATLPPMTHFILPGGNAVSSYAHLARCVCRRAERLSVTLRKSAFVDDITVIYLNRLSDYLFCLARFICKNTDSEEVKWVPRI
jgi:cob(I)alamin adenosyltransferase